MHKPMRELKPSELRRVCDPTQFKFETTKEVAPGDGVIGQERAMRAVEFGISIERQGFNVYALGPVGSGRTTLIRQLLEQRAAQEPVPPDWCYVYNFAEPRRPRALSLPPGRGVELRKDMEALVEHFQREVAKAFDSEEYSQQRNELGQDLQRQQTDEFARLEQMAKAAGFALLRTPTGMGFAPLVFGEVMKPEQYAQLSDEDRKRFDETRMKLEDELGDVVTRLRRMETAAREKARDLDRQVAASAVDQMFGQLTEKYAGLENVLDYLHKVHDDMLEKTEDFKRAAQPAPESPVPGLPMPVMPLPNPGEAYKINVIVDHSSQKGSPVIVSDAPSCDSLVGKIEYQAQFGVLTTNYTLIKPGCLHYANGGYLMIPVKNLLTSPLAYDQVKRALLNREIKTGEIPPALNQFNFISTIGLDPEPIPLDVKVVLIGNPTLYYMLYEADEDFAKLFKVQADFAPDMDRSDEHEEDYAAFIHVRCEQEGLRHFRREAVAKVVEHGSRLIEDQRKLATRFGEVSDLLRESDYWAGKAGHEFVTADDVVKAVEERDYRRNQISERIREAITDGSIFVDTKGAVVGQINGLSVSMLGDYMFGRPSRVTARTFMGRSGVLNIEREVAMAGPIHNKGMLILAGYLGGKFASDKPLNLSASITFEQSYSGVEGDSASSTELYCLLSSLSGIPIRQSIAVTGSVNQLGEVQPIGGATHKIEGYFAVCKEKGLTGEQGVMLPETNVKNLMLREDVVKAVEEGKFHIWAVSTIDQGIEVLTGVPAGEHSADGTYPEGTVNYAVDKKLREFNELLQKFGAPAMAAPDGATATPTPSPALAPTPAG